MLNTILNAIAYNNDIIHNDDNTITIFASNIDKAVSMAHTWKRVFNALILDDSIDNIEVFIAYIDSIIIKVIVLT